jgi:hypothetical protein
VPVGATDHHIYKAVIQVTFYLHAKRLVAGSPFEAAAGHGDALGGHFAAVVGILAPVTYQLNSCIKSKKGLCSSGLSALGIGHIVLL